MGRAVLSALAALLAVPGLVAAQGEGPVTRSRAESVTVTPGASYAAGGLHRFFFGDHYRDLWTTPIRVQVLDLQRFAGGLTPVKRGGGKQTKSLLRRCCRRGCATRWRRESCRTRSAPGIRARRSS